MPARAVGVGRMGWRAAAGLAAICSPALGCATDEGGGEFQSLASGTVTGSVTGTGSEPLDSILIELTVPSQVSSLFAIVGGGGRTDGEGRFSVPVDVIGAENPEALPDTLAIYITATALPPRYAPPEGETSVRDSALVPVPFAPRGDPVPVTEVELTLPVAPAVER